jgi:hypothetical protein
MSEIFYTAKDLIVTTCLSLMIKLSKRFEFECGVV